MTQLVPVLAQDVPMVWPIVAPLLAPAVVRADGQIEIDDVYQQLITRDMQLFTAWDGTDCLAAAVTQIICYPRRKVLGIPFIGGRKRGDWLSFQPVFEAWARDKGCDALEGYARPGWLRVLRDWRHCWTVIRKDL